jgi:type VI secretion system protein VasG
MVKNEIDAVLNLADTLNQRVIGQRHGLDPLMLMVMMFCSPPYSDSASASAVSVLPTPEGPHRSQTGPGFRWGAW